MSEKCISVQTLCNQYGVPKGRVYTAIEKGELPVIRLGSLVRVQPSNIPEYLIQRWARPKRAEVLGDLPAGRLVYFLGVPGFVKVGFTTDLKFRMIQLQPGSPHHLSLLAHLPNGSLLDEKRYHHQFRAQRAAGEWFHLEDRIQEEIDRLTSIFPRAAA